MRRPTTKRGDLARPVGLLLLVPLVGLLLVGLPASAQTITVSSATPNVADQGTVGLVVTITGQNFANGAKAAFFVTGTTNPGGIVVKNVKYKNAKTLEATIDVAADAQTALKFDVSVTCNGRTGKGTELFKVNVKVTGGDSIPPGTIKDLQALPGFNSVVFIWTAPADDGYDPSSGSPVHYDIRVRRGWSTAAPDCGPFTEAIFAAGGSADPCYLGASYPLASSPGSAATDSYAPLLAPETEYWAIIRTLDDASPSGNWSLLSEDLLYQVHFTTSPFPATPWRTAVVGACSDSSDLACPQDPRLAFTRSGDPAVVYVDDLHYVLATWFGGPWPDGGAWSYEAAPGVPNGSSSFDFTFDPVDGDATLASALMSGPKPALQIFQRTIEASNTWASETAATGAITTHALGFNPVASVPTIAYAWMKSNAWFLRLAEKRGNSWASQEVVSSVVPGSRAIGLAFDPTGNPAISFPRDVGGTKLTSFAVRQGGTWHLEVVDTPPGGEWLRTDHTDLAFDPVRGQFSAVGLFGSDSATRRLVRYCERGQSGWTCETVAQGRIESRVSLSVDGAGTAFISFSIFGTLYVATKSPGGTWRMEIVDWRERTSSADIRFGPDGQPAIAFRCARESSFGHETNLVCLSRRTAQ